MNRKMNSRSYPTGGGSTSRIIAFAVLVLVLALLSSCKQQLIVLPPVHDDEITITGPEDFLGQGESFQLSVETEIPSSEITWESSDESVAIVSDDGKVTAVGPGVAEITAKHDGYVSEPVKVTVSGFKATAGFSGTLNPSTEDKTITIEAFGDADSSALPALPTVYPDGAITFTKKTLDDGSVVYEIQSINTTTAECTISFGQGIDIDPITVNIVSKDISVNIGGEDIEAVATEDGKAAIDLSGVIGEDDEIAVIKDKDGNTIYDVNNPDDTEAGYTYDSDDKTLTVDVSEVTDDDLAFTAETVKVLLYDAELIINGREYTRPEFNTLDPKGKFAHLKEACDAVGNNTFSSGIYFRLLDDFTEESFNVSSSDVDVTIDLNGHHISKGDPENPPKGAKYNRIITASLVTGGSCVNIIDGTLKDNDLTANSDILGAAIYVNGPSLTLTDTNWAESTEDWGTMNIVDVTFSNNYTDCGGAICIHRAVKLNIYDSEFIGNRSSTTGGKGYSRPYGTGSAIFVWNTNYRRGNSQHL